MSTFREVAIADRGTLIAAVTGWLAEPGTCIMWALHRREDAPSAFREVTAALDRAGIPVEKAMRANGAEEVRLRNGSLILFRTRGAGRGYAVDKLILDRADTLTEAHMQMLLPLLAGSGNAVCVFAGPARGA